MIKNKIHLILILSILILSMFSSISIFVPVVSALKITESFTEYNGQNSMMYSRYQSTWALACAVTSSYALDFTRVAIWCSPGSGIILQRGFMVFDTSGIPDDAIINSVNLSFTVSAEWGDASRIFIQNSNSGNSIEQTDFNRAIFGGWYADYNWNGTTGFFNVSFNQNVSTSIVRNGYTCLVLRHYNDMYISCPYENGFQIDAEENVKLWVNYSPYNTLPVISLINPLNTSENVTYNPICSIWANDSNGDILTVTWQTNISGSWITKQVNTSVTANTTVRWYFTDANLQWTKYYWCVYVNDTIDNVTESFNFKTMLYYMNISYININPSNNSILNFTKDYIDFSTYIRRGIYCYVNFSFSKSCLQGYNTTTSVYFNNTLLDSKTWINTSYILNIFENYTNYILSDITISWSINTSYYNLSYNQTYYFTPHIIILNAPSGGNGTYNISISLVSSDGFNFSINWTGDYNSTNSNITFPVNRSMIILGTIGVIKMIIEYNLTQLGIVILMIMSFFFLVIGLSAKDKKFGGLILLFDGILFFYMSIGVVALFGAVWLLISPGLILISILIAIYGVLSMKG